MESRKKNICRGIPESNIRFIFKWHFPLFQLFWNSVFLYPFNYFNNSNFSLTFSLSDYRSSLHQNFLKAAVVSSDYNNNFRAMWSRDLKFNKYVACKLKWTDERFDEDLTSLFGYPFVSELFLSITISLKLFDLNTWNVVYMLLIR